MVYVNTPHKVLALNAQGGKFLWKSGKGQFNVDFKEASEANGELLNVNALAYGAPHPADANYFTVELPVLKEMAQALADLFGLTLPLPGQCNGLEEEGLFQARLAITDWRRAAFCG